MFTKKITTPTPADALSTAIESLKAQQATRAAAVDRLQRAEAALRAVDDQITSTSTPAQPLRAELARLSAGERMGEVAAGTADRWTIDNLKKLTAEREEARAADARRAALEAEREALAGVLGDAAAKLAAAPVPHDARVECFDKLIAINAAAYTAAAEEFARQASRLAALASVARLQSTVARYAGDQYVGLEPGCDYVLPPSDATGNPIPCQLPRVIGGDVDAMTAVNAALMRGPSDAEIAAATKEIADLGIAILPASERVIRDTPRRPVAEFVTRPAEVPGVVHG